MKNLFILMTFLIVTTLNAQDNNEPLYLEITFPAQSDTVNADRVRLSGHTQTDAILRINDRRVALFPQGSFATRVDLQEGMNQIIITAQRGDELVQDILFIYRPETRESLRREPTAINKATVAPLHDVWLMNGEYLSVEFQGSPGGQAVFSVEKLAKDIPMVELPPAQSHGVEGVYHGIIKLQELPEGRALSIEFELAGVDGKKKRRQAEGKLYILSDQMPLIGQTSKPAFIHAVSKGYVPISRIQDSVKVHIIGREADRFKIDLLNRTGYIDAHDIKLLSSGSPLPRTTVGAPQIRQDKEWFHLIVPIGERVPYETSVTIEPLTVNLTLWGARQASHWITYPNIAIDLITLNLEQTDEFVFQLSATLNQARPWGHKVVYKEGALHLSIRRQPLINPRNPVQNLAFAIDPGHGGEETGAVSPLGVFEKDINWQWAQALEALLRQNGARVIQTRTGDETVSLQQRIERAEAADALFFISLHNNVTTAFGNLLSA